MKVLVSLFGLLLGSGLLLHASVNISGTIAVDVEGVNVGSVGVLVVDTQSAGFAELVDILSVTRDGVLDSNEDYDFENTGYQAIGVNTASDVFGTIALGGSALFPIAPNDGSAVLPGDAFALVVFTDPVNVDSDVLVFLRDDWVVPADGATVTFASELTQLNADATADYIITMDGGEPPDPNANWFAEASQLSDGWRFFDWFKGFKPAEGENWIFHARHGWLFVQAEDTSGIFLWDAALGRWMWTNADIYPWMYAYGPDEGWVFFFEGGRPGRRYFKRGDTGEVVSEQDLSLNP